MTMEEYIIERIKDLETQNLAYRERIEDYKSRLQSAVEEANCLNDTLGELQIILAPRIKSYAGSRSIEFNSVADWHRVDYVDKIIEIFGIESEEGTKE